MAKTTLNIDEKVIQEAMATTGIHEKTAVVNFALKELLKRKASERLIARGGADPHASAPARKRSGTR